MDKKEDFILSVIKKIETMQEGIIAYGFFTGNLDMSYTWYQINVSDYNFYMKDERFKKMSTVWHKAAKARGFLLVFVMGWYPKEQNLLELADKNNLILNI
jgi:hypothetical protein